MDKNFGLVGGVVKQSFSKVVHHYLGDYDYQLISLDNDELKNYILKKNYQGINVTIPYKKEVMKYLDNIDDAAYNINAVNTIINRDGMLYGYNTDYAGLKYLLQNNNVKIKDKNVVILGTGGTSNTAYHVCRDLGAKSIHKVSRSNQADALSYSDIYTQTIDVIINTTPVGMYPNIEKSPICVSDIVGLEAVVDVIYNPLKTQLLCDAESLGIQAVGGLEMLIHQAVIASELFLDQQHPETMTEEIFQKIMRQQRNIVLLGMPSAGKSTIGKLVAERLNRDFVDTDVLIELKEEMSIPEIFEKRGESYFRKQEHTIISDVAKKNGIVIATGGGVIKNIENINNLKKNGVLIFIDRELEDLSVDDSRPLSKNYAAVRDLYNERYCYYQEYSDCTITNNSKLEEVVKQIVEAVQ